MTSEELFQLVLDTRGYLVIGQRCKFPVGHVVLGVNHMGSRIEHPFRIISETTKADGDEQTKLMGLVDDGRVYTHYYRCITD